MTGTLNGHSQLALMAGAGAGHSARQNLRALGNIAAESGYILVINRFHFIYTEAANLLTVFPVYQPWYNPPYLIFVINIKTADRRR